MAKERDLSGLNRRFSEYLLHTLASSIAASELLSSRLEKLALKEKDPDAIKYLAILRHSQFQSLRLAENLQELTEEDGGTVLRRAAVDLNELCCRLADSIRVLLPDIEIVCRPSPEACITSCDEDRIERLILNLLSNSLLHTPSGGSVLIRLQSTEETVQVVISDNGSGIPRERMDTLFSDYLRIGEFSEPHRGAGIGLAVADRIARAHGGSLVITSDEGHGTKAVFSLPRVSTLELHSYREPRYGRMRTLLIARSDVLDSDKYQPPFL